MTMFCLILLFSGLLCTATAEALYPEAIQRPPSVLHDFQKNNVSSSWALGHPKEWSDKDALRYEFSDGGPYRYTSGAIFATALSSDERFLVTVNTSNHVSVIDFATGVQVFDRTLSSTYQAAYRAVRVLAGPSGYEVLASMTYQEVQKLQLSPQGEQIGNVTVYPGGLLYEKGSPSTSHNERLFITAVPTAGQYTIYDLDEPSVHLTLNNQPDDMYDASFTPDDQYVVTRSYSYSGMPGSTRMWDVKTGALVRDFNNTNSETLSISPDGSLLATSLSWEAIQIWSLTNATAPPTTLTFPEKTNINGVQRLAWSPDSTYLAVGTYKNLLVWKLISFPELVQWYQIEANGHDVSGLLWLSGSKRLAYRVFGGLEIYDCETNLKYRWGNSPNSHWVDGAYMVENTILAKGKGWIGGWMGMLSLDRAK
ncbi:uncharacterized protein N0V89_008986 [Didymosphaeria variabile]|uniref:WD40 repeat-like protein n=1 Tax=Didymosphaeria variabile TaxID=1932322 RepID=A0A9W8XHA9_9PLEO|nr:uncharacterized protein N0V89_008986 [Didymosphaeria variabile]KAJ4350365.1 hypothetical protein N0V89_008986 [Didymosphaeria variabile]